MLSMPAFAEAAYFAPIVTIVLWLLTGYIGGGLAVTAKATYCPLLCHGPSKSPMTHE